MPRRERHCRRRSLASCGRSDSSVRISDSVASFGQHLLDFGNGPRGIQILRAGLGAIHDGVTAIQAERVLELIEALTTRFVAAVDDPAISREQCGGAEVALAVP